MTDAPAGWYPDPENAAAKRYWTGSEWAAPKAPKALPITALVLAVAGPLTIVVFALCGAILSGLGYVMGMPNAGEVAVQAATRFAQLGAVVAVPLVIVAIVLAAIASARTIRSRRLVLASWIAIAVSVFFTGMTFLAPTLLW
jgi:hypothetical protein